MTKAFFHLLTVMVLILFFSCGDSVEDNKRVVGEWRGVSWKAEGNETGRDASTVRFDFNADNTYAATFGNQTEKGKFRLSGNKLYTTAEGKAEKLVQIALKGADTLVMEMNRVGTMEELVLVKE